MTNPLWSVFPYPTLSGSEHTSGSLLDAHPDCISCTSYECLSDSKGTPAQIQMCRFGITYARLDDDRVVVGVLATDVQNQSLKAKKRLRNERQRHVKSSQILKAIEVTRKFGPGVVNDVKRARKDVLERLVKEPEMHKALADQLRQDFDKNFQQSHDFLQLVNLVRGHAEALLYEKFPSMVPEDAAEQCEIEGAIYFSTRLMVMKIDSLVFLQEINLVFGETKRLQIHPLVVSYARIYKWQATQKNVDITIDGECRASSIYNNQAIGAVIQGILDNLVKYAPAGSDAQIHFEQRGKEIYISFSSLGPKIEQNETSKIFLPGYRAEAARAIELSGQGIGLATAKAISDALNLNLTVTQSEVVDGKYFDRFPTKFQIILLAEK